MFTKEHHTEIAKVLRDVEVRQGNFYKMCVLRGGHSTLVRGFILLFERDNSSFDRRKFLAAIYNKKEVVWVKDESGVKYNIK